MDIKNLKINQKYKLYRNEGYDIARLIKYECKKHEYHLYFKYEGNDVSESCWSYSENGIGQFTRGVGELERFLELITD